MSKDSEVELQLPRKFRITIERHIWLNKSLSLQEKAFIAEIDSLDADEKGCYATNAYFAKFFSLSIKRVEAILSKLVKMGFVRSTLDRSKRNPRRLVVLPSKTRAITLRANKCRATLKNKGCATLENEGSYPQKQGQPTLISEGSIYKEENIEEYIERRAYVFVDYWNSKTNLPKINSFPIERKRLLAARMSETEFTENFKTIIDNLDASKFHTGRTTCSEWVATADWLLSDRKNYLKILDMVPASVRKQEKEQAAMAAAERNKHEQRLAEVRVLSTEKLQSMRTSKNCTLYWPAIDEVLTQRRQTQPEQSYAHD